MDKKPTGLVTFLFTDIQGSTKLAQEFPTTLQSSLDKHHLIMHYAVESNNGFVFLIVGDAFCCAFVNAEDAVTAAVQAQTNLLKEKWDDAVIKVRMGIHSGNAEWNGQNYMGYLTLARSNRIMSAAYGGQIILSDSSYEFAKEKVQSRISFRDLGERRLKDVISPIKLFQVLSTGLQEDFPPLKTLDARPNNIPVQLTSFIGREAEIIHIKELLNKAHLLTLTGPGGTGKTRLAIQVAADVIDDYSNGVWIADLASISDPSLLTPAVMKIFGLKEELNSSHEQTLCNYLGEKEILIIFDNCEHLVQACSDLAEKLLSKTPKLKLIATSRESLRCSGEQIHRVSFLDTPDPKELLSPEKLSQYESVRLFIERALAVNPSFRISDNNAVPLAKICFQLEGIPLAIELAAARTRILSIEQIQERLNDRFRLLTGGNRTALPRQQTLRALIDWSYDLLAEKEKQLFKRLSVFSGGWTLESAEAVCHDRFLEGWEIFDAHSNLIDKSLINTIEVNGSRRFSFLESIRQYAGNLPGDNKATDENHLNFFSKLADHVQMMKEGIGQMEWVRLVEADEDNIRAAINRAAKNEFETACTMVVNMTEFWMFKGYFLEGRIACMKLIEMNSADEGLCKAQLLYSAGLMLYNLGNITDAENYLNESLSIFRKSESRENIARCLNMKGAILNLNIETQNEALEAYKEALSIFSDLKIKKETGVTLYNISFLEERQGNLELALQNKKEALEIFREINDTHQVTLITTSLGIFEYKRNNFGAARSYTEESLANSKLFGDKYLISINLINLGCIYSELGQYKKSYELLEESFAILEEYGYKSNMIVALMYMGEVSSKLGEEEKAISLYKRSIQTSKEAGTDFFLTKTFYRLGISYFNLEDFENSLRYFLFMNVLSGCDYPFNPQKKENAKEYDLKLRDILGEEKYNELVNETANLGKDKTIAFVVNSQ